jgi:hypothetical protein
VCDQIDFAVGSRGPERTCSGGGVGEEISTFWSRAASLLQVPRPCTFDPCRRPSVHWPASSIPVVNVPAAAAPTSGRMPAAISAPSGRPLPSHGKARCGAAYPYPPAGVEAAPDEGEDGARPEEDQRRQRRGEER